MKVNFSRRLIKRLHVKKLRRERTSPSAHLVTPHGHFHAPASPNDPVGIRASLNPMIRIASPSAFGSPAQHTDMHGNNLIDSWYGGVSDVSRLS